MPLSLRFLTYKMGSTEPTLPGCYVEPGSQSMPSPGTPWAGGTVRARPHSVLAGISVPLLSPSVVLNPEVSWGWVLGEEAFLEALLWSRRIGDEGRDRGVSNTTVMK